MTIRKVSYLQGTVPAPYKMPAEDHRLNHAMLWTPDNAAPRGPLGVRSGIVPGPGSPFAVTVAAGGVNINPGHAVIQGTLSTTQGPYEVTSDAVEFRAITAASASEFRRGYVIARVYDSLNPGAGTVQDLPTLEVVYGPNAGTAGAAQLPPVPDNSLVLREFAVSNTGVITLVGAPTWTARRDGRVTVADEAARLALPAGTLFDRMQVYVTATRRTWEWSVAGNGWALLIGPKPHFSAYLIGAPLMVGSTFTAVLWDGEEADTDNGHVAGSDVYTIPFQGYYLCQATLSWNVVQSGTRVTTLITRPLSTGAAVFVRGSGAAIDAVDQAWSPTQVPSPRLRIPFQAGDQLWAAGYQNGAANLALVGLTATAGQPMYVSTFQVTYDGPL